MIQLYHFEKGIQRFGMPSSRWCVFGTFNDRLLVCFCPHTVVFKDVDGNEFKYAVGAKEVLPPAAIEEMTSGEWDFTLFTCNRTGTYRIAVRCDKTNG